MILFRSFILFLCLASLLSCENDKENIKYYKKFKNNFSLKGETIANISDSIYPQSIDIYKDKLIFADYSSNPHFYAYQLPDFKFLAKFGDPGDGPTDFESPVIWNQIENGKIGIYQMNKMLFDFYDIEDLLKGEINKNQLNPVYMPPEVNDAVNVINLKDNIYIGSGSYSKGEFFVYNSITKNLYWKDYIEIFDDAYLNKINEYDLLPELKLGIIKIKPDKSMFVKTNIYNPLVYVFDNNMDLKFTIANQNLKPPVLDDGKKSFSSETKMYYTNCYLTDKFIYTVYRNCSLEEYNNYECNNVEIHAFDWEGKPISKYYLNEGIAPMSSFVIDEQRLKIYTINPKTEDSYYSIFDMNVSPN